MSRRKKVNENCYPWQPTPLGPREREISVEPDFRLAIDINLSGLSLLQRNELEDLMALMRGLLEEDSQSAYQELWPGVIEWINDRGCIDPLEPAAGEPLVDVGGQILPESIVRSHIRKQMLVEALPAIIGGIARGAAMAGRAAVQVGSRVAGATARGIGAAARGVGSAVKTGAQAAGKVAGQAAKAAGQGVKAVGNAAGNAAKQVGQGVKQAGQSARNQFQQQMKSTVKDQLTGAGEKKDTPTAKKDAQAAAGNAPQAPKIDHNAVGTKMTGDFAKNSGLDAGVAGSLTPAFQGIAQVAGNISDPAIAAAFAKELQAALPNLPSVKKAAAAKAAAEKKAADLAKQQQQLELQQAALARQQQSLQQGHRRSGRRMDGSSSRKRNKN